MTPRNDFEARDQVRAANVDDDPKGEHGGDTGKTDQKGKGPRAEKGDQRRETPLHGGPTRPGSQGTDSQHGKRSGSESDANQ